MARFVSTFAAVGASPGAGLPGSAPPRTRSRPGTASTCSRTRRGDTRTTIVLPGARRPEDGGRQGG
jgi:hypothetical protein